MGGDFGCNTSPPSPCKLLLLLFIRAKRRQTDRKVFLLQRKLGPLLLSITAVKKKGLRKASVPDINLHLLNNILSVLFFLHKQQKIPSSHICSGCFLFLFISDEINLVWFDTKPNSPPPPPCIHLRLYLPDWSKFEKQTEFEPEHTTKQSLIQIQTSWFLW